MSIEQIIKAWKDEDFRNSLTPEQLENLPESPIELFSLTTDELESVVGAEWGWYTSPSVGCQ